MQRSSSGVVVALLALSICAVLAEPKAYDLVKYRGNVGEIVIAFDFGDGYPEASELRLTEHGKRVPFRLEKIDSESMAFIPANDRKRSPNDDRQVLLNIGSDDAAPDKVSGIYRNGSKKLSFTLKRNNQRWN